MGDKKSTTYSDEDGLRTLGGEIVEAANGEQAMTRMCVQQGIGLIVLAREMPVMDGMEFLTWLRDIPEFVQEPKVIMVSDDSSRLSILKAMSAGADEYIMKPFDSDIFLQKLQVLGLMPTERFTDGHLETPVIAS